MSREQPKGKTVNEGGSSGDNDTRLTQRRSGPVRYQIISSMGFVVGAYDTALEAASAARGFWPDQSHDPDRTGSGWDIQIRPKKSL